MAAYAIIENGIVINTMLWDGDTENWQPPDGQIAVEIPDDARVTTGTKYADGAFVPDAIEEIPPFVPSASDILQANTSTRDGLLSAAALAIGPLQDAVDLDEATDAETALLKTWKQYRIAVNRVDLTTSSPTWPVAPA